MKKIKIMKFLEEWKLDGVILTSLKSIRYYTGFSGSAGMALITRRGGYLLVDARYTLQGERETAGRDIEVHTVPKGSIAEAGEIIRERGLVALGYEDREVSVCLFSQIEDMLKGVELKPVGDEIAKLKMEKDQEEIECIERGNRILDQIFSEVVQGIGEFRTEREVAAYIEYRMKLLGSEGPSFDTIVAWRENSAFPHWKTSDTPIEGKGFLKMDFGCYIGGYGSDMTRTIHIGRADERAREIYTTVLEAQEMAIEGVQEGVTTREADRIARDHIISRGYGEYFQHGLGHGLGLGGGEVPYLSDISEEIELRENMVVTIEPGIYIPGYGGVRIEDDVVITKSGCRNLTTTTKKLIEIV